MAEILNIQNLRVRFHDAAPDRFAVNGAVKIIGGLLLGVEDRNGVAKAR